MPAAPPSVNIGAWTSFKGVQDASSALLMEQLESNICEFFKWGLLGIGAFYNVTIPTSGAYGGDFSPLRCSEDPNYPKGAAWEAGRFDWVWESGVQYATQPISISGVWVNHVFYPNGSAGPSGGNFHINYPLGRILFDNPISLNSTVQCEYSFRQWQVYPGSTPWFRQIQFNSMRIDDFEFQQYGSGVWSILSEERVQLPALVIEAVPRRSMVGYGLGFGTRVNQDIVFHIFAENPTDMKKMHDIVTYQWQKEVLLYDKNLLAQANGFPLDPQYGSIASGAKCYPDLVSPTSVGGYGWSRATFLEMQSYEAPCVPPLYACKVRASTQVDVGNI